MSNLPQWIGASKVYGNLYKVLEILSFKNYNAERVRAKKKRTKIKTIYPTDESVIIMEALARGNEEECKYLQLKYISYILKLTHLEQV